MIDFPTRKQSSTAHTAHAFLCVRGSLKCSICTCDDCIARRPWVGRHAPVWSLEGHAPDTITPTSWRHAMQPRRYGGGHHAKGLNIWPRLYYFVFKCQKKVKHIHFYQRNGLILAGIAGYNRIMVEAEWMEVIKNIGDSFRPATGIFEECSFLCRSFDHLIFCQCPREDNIVAHVLASPTEGIGSLCAKSNLQNLFVL
jgi:hypothetical protein